MSWSVSASVTSNELWPQAIPSRAPQSQNNRVSHSGEPVQLQSRSIRVESHALSSASPDMQKGKGNMEIIISHMFLSFGLPSKCFSQQQSRPTVLVQCVISPDVFHIVAQIYMVHKIIFHIGFQSSPLPLFSDQWAHHPSGLDLLIVG